MTSGRSATGAPGDDWMLVGRVAGAFGVHGELKVDPLTDFPRRFEELEVVYTGEKHFPRTVLSARVGRRILLRLEGISSREDAQALRGTSLWVPRDQAVGLPEGQYYRDELVGLRVETEEGEALGSIDDILETGANDVYIVRSEGRELLVPAIQDVVVAIEVGRGRIIIRPLPGMFD
ncbi:MAG TPA: ribosome maturation factor RimM [Chloroflexota bacterium]|nr:ribosome maturation factor RimM [Chloroflexota bacterium]